MVARNRIVLSGRLGSAEVWSVSMHYAGAGGEVVGGSAGLTGWAEAVRDYLEADGLGTPLPGLLSTTGTIDTVRTYQYDASGPAVAVGEALVDYNGSGSTVNPFQTCCVMTLRCDQIGARYRGRVYWPAIGNPVAGGFFTGFAPSLNIADRFAQALTDIGEAASPVADLLPQVYSPTYDLLTAVSSVTVDTVPDVQRRRADNLVGTVYQSAVPAAP